MGNYNVGIRNEVDRTNYKQIKQFDFKQHVAGRLRRR
jgi:hypothetical protein